MQGAVGEDPELRGLALPRWCLESGEFPFYFNFSMIILKITQPELFHTLGVGETFSRTGAWRDSPPTLVMSSHAFTSHKDI